MERSFLDDVGAVAVFADQLEEQGDPRAELVRAQLAGDVLRAGELIKLHGPQWLGPLKPKDSLLRWKHGFVVDAALRSVPEHLGASLERPAFRFLERLALGPSVQFELSGLASARALRSLVWFADQTDSLSPLDGLELKHLESFTLKTSATRLDGLSNARFPQLRQLHTGCTAGNEETLLQVLAKASWWPTLTRWSHRVASRAGLLALLRCQPLRERIGGGFVALCSAALLAQVTNELREALPLAEFKLLSAPQTPRDPEDSNGAPEVSVCPAEGRIDFRELPGWVTKSERSTQNENGTDTISDGPGLPFTHLSFAASEFTACGWCSSEETRCIHLQDWSMYSHFETTTYRRWESECADCGLFTRSRSSRTR